ncbi:MAG TPA: hypothetical protein VHA55_14905 [Pseudorhodoplanes sp.]|jgi:hypothetical protein|nr:hypothetical protein [Pseudorhodoplanes sp.]
MDSRRHIRPFLALVAAYAIALQAVIAGMTLGAGASRAAALASGGWCVSDPSHPEHAPLEQMPCCVGAVCCQAGGDPGALPQAVAYEPGPSKAGSPLGLPAAHAGVFSLAGCAQPRAPPAPSAA